MVLINSMLNYMLICLIVIILTFVCVYNYKSDAYARLGGEIFNIELHKSYIGDIYCTPPFVFSV